MTVEGVVGYKLCPFRDVRTGPRKKFGAVKKVVDTSLKVWSNVGLLASGSKASRGGRKKKFG